MSPSHATKAGVRYRYYVSQALLQHRKTEAGSVARVAAPDIDALVVGAVRQHLDREIIHDGAPTAVASSDDITDHDLITAHVRRVTLHAQNVEIILNSIRPDPATADATETEADVSIRNDADGSDDECSASIVLVVPWAPKAGNLRKGIAHEPAGKQVIDPQARAALLAAIAKARNWIEDIFASRVASFAEIAHREQKGERHIRLLEPLAFVSPKIINAITAGSAPASLTVSALARSLPHLWSEQEKHFRIG